MTLLVAAYQHVETWGVAPGEEPLLRHTLREGWASHASVSPDGKHAAAGGCKGEPTDVWDLASGARVLQLAADPENNTWSVSWLPSGDVIATCSSAGVVRFWSFSSADPGSSGQRIGQLDVFGGGLPRRGVVIWDFCLSPSGSAIAACGGADAAEDDNHFVAIFRAPALSPLQRQLNELLRSKRGADVTLACSGGGAFETRAHSLILALRSGTLQRQLDWGAERQAGASAGGGASASGSHGGGGGGAGDPLRLEIDGSVEPAILERLLEYLCAPRRMCKPRSLLPA
jgi:hypothetical protein